MREIKEIIIHCSDTPAGRDYTVDDITRWHKARGFRTIGYHYVIYRDGSIHTGRPESETGAHCLDGGHNRHSIGICYIGGRAADGKGYEDTRTPEQKEALLSLLRQLKARYPHARVYGHRDFAARACPCFDAAGEYRQLVMALLLVFSSCIFSSCRATKKVVEEKADSSVVQTLSRSSTSSTTDKFWQNIVLRIDSIVCTMPSVPPVSEAHAEQVSAGTSGTRSPKPHAVKGSSSSPHYGKVVVSGISLHAVTADSCNSTQNEVTDMKRQSASKRTASNKADKRPSLVPWLSFYLVLFIAVAVAVAIAMAKSSRIWAAVCSLFRKVLT